MPKDPILISVTMKNLWFAYSHGPYFYPFLELYFPSILDITGGLMNFNLMPCLVYW